MIEFKKKLGLALGGGGAKGFAYIGALKFFEDKNIKIDYLAGTSIGALIGALYASGYSIDKLTELAKEFSLRDQIRLFDVGLPQGLFKGNKVIKFLENYIRPDLTFSDLEIPFSVTAVDLMTGNLKIINSGNVVEAVRASISYPYFFRPFITGSEILVDGGILLNIPISPLWQLGANYVVAISVSHFLEFEEQDNILKTNFLETPAFIKILLRSLAITTKTIEQNYLEIYEPDVMIDIFTEDLGVTDFYKAEAKHLIEKGYRAMQLKESAIIRKKMFYTVKKVKYARLHPVPVKYSGADEVAHNN